MKKILTAALLVFLGTTASAQLAFNGANIAVGGSFLQNAGIGSYTNYKASANADFSLGAFGLQADIGISGFPDQAFFGNLITYDAGLHVYRTFGKVKGGVFYSAEYIASRGSFDYIASTYGIEAIVDLGKFDIEASLAGVGGPFFGSGLLLGSLAGYYQINDAFEVSLGVQSLVASQRQPGANRGRGSDSLSRYSIGGRFQFPNIPVSISASYSATDANASSAVSAFISYGFGGAVSSTRAFQRRNLNYFELLISAIGS